MSVTGLNWLKMVECCGAEYLDMLLGLFGCKCFSVLVWNIERPLLGLTGWKWYSDVVRSDESLLVGLTGCKCYRVLVRNVESPLLGLTGWK